MENDLMHIGFAILPAITLIVGYVVGIWNGLKDVELEKVKTERDMLHQRLCEWDEKQKYN